MCGIAGMISLRSGSRLRCQKIIDDMLQLIVHRGPDDTGVCGLTKEYELLTFSGIDGFHQKLKAVFGFNRLSIRDMTQAGHQPMLSQDKKVVLTFNGEVYNAGELREQLQKDGYVFRGTSDTEVILALYLSAGFENMITALNGMFAIIIFDTRIHKLFMARDRYGIIPLYLLFLDGELVWASEIKCFRALPGFKREIDIDALSEVLKYTFPECVVYKNVEALGAGTIRVIDIIEGNQQIIQYYDMNCKADVKTGVLPELIEQTEDIVKSCVHRQLVSDVDVGVQFSGGIDSTLVAKYVSDEFLKQGKHLYGFSLINSGSMENSEEDRMDFAASHLSIDIHKTDMSKRLWVDSLDHCTYIYEKLVNTPSAIGIYQFSKQARKNVTVLLSGEGADELCGGYKEFVVHKKKEQISRINHVMDIYSDNPSEKSLHDYLADLKTDQSSDVCKKLFPDYREEHFLHEREQYWRSLNGSFFEKYRMMLFRYHLVGLLERQNKMCMANSVENRVPFLDNEFVDFILTLPEDVLIHESKTGSDEFVGKDLLKRISEKIYGHDFAYLRKTNMRVPLMEYMSSDYFKEYIFYQILPSLKNRGILDVNYFLNMFHNMNARNIMTIWRAVNIELWCQNFIDR